jgi:hypothetical protein
MDAALKVDAISTALRDLRDLLQAWPLKAVAMGTQRSILQAGVVRSSGLG